MAVGSLSMHGQPYPWSARYALQQAIADWGALGLRPKVGIELEAYVLEPNGEGGWQRWQTPRAFVYGTGLAADPVGVIDDIMRTAEASQFKVESINAEFDEAQFELTLEYDDALAAADDAFLFRVLAREVALSHGLDLTFLGKPFAELSGSGVHVNFSFVDAVGNNPLADPSAPNGLSDATMSCVAGLVEHHQALAALCAPTVNAYRRLLPGQLNGYWANWGLEHRCAANRIPSARGVGTRIENRVADGAVNLHLAVATVLQAARLGYVNQLVPPDPAHRRRVRGVQHRGVRGPRSRSRPQPSQGRRGVAPGRGSRRDRQLPRHQGSRVGALPGRRGQPRAGAPGQRLGDRAVPDVPLTVRAGRDPPGQGRNRVTWSGTGTSIRIDGSVIGWP